MNVKPTFGRIILKPTKSEKTENGIYIPVSAQHKTQTAEVVSISEKEGVDEFNFNVGDVVIYDTFAGNKIKIDGETHVIIGVGDILAIVK